MASMHTWRGVPSGLPSPTRKRQHEHISEGNERTSRGICEGDQRLAAAEEPSLGAHLITPRFAYAHHGIYVGGGTVVHYGAFAHNWHRRPVEEVSFSDFAQGRPIWIRPSRTSALKPEEIVRRARSRLGEDRYRLLTNNCEHFSEWSVHGEHRSWQAEHFLSPVCALTGALNGLIRQWRAATIRLLRTTDTAICRRAHDLRGPSATACA